MPLFWWQRDACLAGLLLTILLVKLSYTDHWLALEDRDGCFPPAEGSEHVCV